MLTGHAGRVMTDETWVKLCPAWAILVGTCESYAYDAVTIKEVLNHCTERVCCVW